MDEATQQNSALVEENAATAKALENQSKAMDERVSFFRLGDGTPADESAAVTAPKAKIVAAPKRSPAAWVVRSGAAVRQMRTALATAIAADTEF